MKKNHLDFKSLAQSLAMDKGKLERYVEVSFLLKLFNHSHPRQIYNPLLILFHACMNGEFRILQELLCLGN